MIQYSRELMSDRGAPLHETRAWLAGDDDAGTALFAFYGPRVFRFFELRAPTMAADLTQQTLLACFEKRESVRSAESFRSFVFGVARNQFFRHLRVRQRMDAIGHAVEVVSTEATTSLSTVYARTHEQRILLQALLELPPDTSMLLGLYHWEGLSTHEIAVALEIPPSTVTTRLSRARAKLRQEIEALSAPGRARAALLEDPGALARWLEGLSSEALLSSLPDAHATR